MYMYIKDMHIHHVYKVCVYICFISLHVKLLNIILKCVHAHTLLRACYNTHISSIVCSVIDYNLKLLQYKSNKNHQKVFLKIKPPLP